MAAGDMEKLREIYVFVAFLVGTGCLLLAAFQAYAGNLKSFAALGMVTLLCGIFLFLSQIKTFKIWEVQVELRETLDRAEEIMEKMRRLSAVTSRVGYMSIAWGNRFGSPSAKDKQAILDTLGAQMTELGVSAEERKAITDPYINLIGWDFYVLYVRVVERYIYTRYTGIAKKMNAGDKDPVLKETIERWAPLMTSWRNEVYRDGLFAKAKAGEIDALLKEAYPTGLFDAKETTAANRLSSEVSALFKASAAKGGFTTEAADYYDKFHDGDGRDRKVLEMFGFDPVQASK